MPKFDQVRGVAPSLPEYEDVKVRIVEIRTMDGQQADFTLDEGDSYELDDTKLRVNIRLDKNNEMVNFNYNHVVSVSCRDAVVKRPKKLYRPEGYKS